MQRLNNSCYCCSALTEDDEGSVQIDGDILDKLRFVVGSEVDVTFQPSSWICQGCLNKLNQFDTFKRQVLIKQQRIKENSSKVSHVHIDPPTETLTIEKLNETFRCSECDQQFKRQDRLSKHLEQTHDIHQCLQCGLNFKTQWKCLRHARIVHRKAIAETNDLKICPHCGKALKGTNHLNLHIKMKHLKLTRFSCDLCDFKSYGKYEIRSHIEIHHRPLELRKEFPCDLCNSVLTTAVSLKTHKIHKHSNVKPHECFCGKSFSLRETLKTHIKNVHQGERKYKCNECEKGFNSIVRLKDHVNNYHGNKQEFSCDNCRKTFNSSRNLKTHSIYHLPPSHCCKDCDKKFFTKKSLVEHEESVHMEVTHECEKCKKKFQSTSGLRRHLKNCH